MIFFTIKYIPPIHAFMYNMYYVDTNQWLNLNFTLEILRNEHLLTKTNEHHWIQTKQHRLYISARFSTFYELKCVLIFLSVQKLRHKRCL